MTTDTKLSAARRPDRGAAPAGRAPRRWRKFWAGWTPWLFVAPILLLIIYFKYIPLGNAFVNSFEKVQPFLGNEFIGLDNYTAALTDAGFRNALGNTIFIAVVSTVGATLAGLFLALLLESNSKIFWFVRSAVFLPVVTAAAVSAETWRVLMYPDALGFLNSLLSTLGIPPQLFLSSPSTALISVTFVIAWTHAPYNMIIFLAGLSGIDRTLYEAAALDGAGVMRRLWSVVMPSLRPMLTIILTLAAIRSLRTFTEVYVLTGGGPAGSTDVWMIRLYNVGTLENNVGLSSAASILLLIITVGLTFVVQRISQRRD